MQTFQQEMIALRANEQAARDTIAALTAQADELNKALTAAVEAAASAQATHAADIAKMQEKLDAADRLASEQAEAFQSALTTVELQGERIVELEAQIALVPALGDVSKGQPPVADGGTAGDGVDLVTKVEGMKGAERIAFYRANQAAIDAAYARKQRK